MDLISNNRLDIEQWIFFELEMMLEQSFQRDCSRHGGRKNDKLFR